MRTLSGRMLALASAGIACLVAASPATDRLADSTFAWHMGQHLVLLFIVPFCILASSPFALFTRLAGKRAAAQIVRATRPMHAVTHPVIAFCAFVGTLWAMHFTGLYESSLEQPQVHILEHGLVVAAGLAFWIPVLAPSPVRPLAFPARLLYLVTLLPQGALLALALGAANQPLYEHYLRLEGFAGAAADQRTAAAVMWIGGGLVTLTAFLVTLAVWAARETRMEPA